MSLTKAAAVLNMTKGAVSYQISQLEKQLGFTVFQRIHGGVQFTEKGKQLHELAVSLFENIEQEIRKIKTGISSTLTIGMTTYFASRWLAPRLMRFTSNNPDIQIRIQPITGRIQPIDEGIDVAVQWGDGDWPRLDVELVFRCPAFATGNSQVAALIEQTSLINAVASQSKLHDFEDSTAWRQWHKLSGVNYQPGERAIIITDPNVRVEAVVNGQGIALNDSLVSPELDSGRLIRLSDHSLDNYGYFLTYAADAREKDAVRLFRQWILQQAAESN